MKDPTHAWGKCLTCCVLSLLSPHQSTLVSGKEFTIEDGTFYSNLRTYQFTIVVRLHSCIAIHEHIYIFFVNEKVKVLFIASSIRQAVSCIQESLYTFTEQFSEASV